RCSTARPIRCTLWCEGTAHGASLMTSGEGRRVRAYVSESDHWHGKPLGLALVQMLHDEGSAGATLVRGVAGFGIHGRIHSANLADLGQPLPMIVEWIDTPERVEK